ncbi:MAG: type II toxin-antitoxin system RelE/ParE family toxin [Terriglobales bacterium]
MRLDWHPLARADLAELVAYIASDSPAAAYRVHDEIRKQTRLLAAHPEIGRPGRVRGTRELVVTGTPYIAAYRFIGEVVTVLRLLHGARLWPRKL